MDIALCQWWMSSGVGVWKEGVDDSIWKSIEGCTCTSGWQVKSREQNRVEEGGMGECRN